MEWVYSMGGASMAFRLRFGVIDGMHKVCFALWIMMERTLKSSDEIFLPPIRFWIDI
jgi:hypothetical protein